MNALGEASSVVPEEGPAGESLEQANARLTLVNGIAAAIGSNLGMDEVIDLAVRTLARAFPGVRVSYSVVDAEDRVTVERSVEPAGMPSHRGASWSLAGAAEYLAAVRRQEIVVSEDVSTDRRMAPLAEIMAESGVRALATAALPQADGRSGLLSFNAPAPTSWTEHELATLTEAAAYLFLAIQEARHERDRAAAEESLRRRAELETFLVRLSTDFINMPAARIDRAVGEVLPELARAAEADAILVFLFSDDRSKLVNAYEWLSPAVGTGQERPAALATWELPGLMKTLARLEPFCAPNPRMLAPEERAEREHFERYGLRSLLGIPISTRGELLGFVGLVQLFSDRGWREEAVVVLRVVGDIFGGALDRKRSTESLERAQAQLEAGNRELEWSNRAMILLNELGDLLQTCNRFEESAGVIDDLLPKIFPGRAGAVYVFGASSSLLEPLACWGNPPPDDGLFGPEDCWALRRGRPHRVEPSGGGPACPHVAAGGAEGSLCVPLMAQGRALGMLHLRGADASPQHDSTQLADSTAEHLSLGLANLLLRERLRSQALRDPLTGLVNRVYLEEQLGREVPRARRKTLPLSLLVFGLDGHADVVRDHGAEAGDQLISEAGKLLLQQRPAEGLAARLEGATMALLLPEHGAQDARRVAEALDQAVRELEVVVGRLRIEAGTLSIGLATYPLCAEDGQGLLAAAAAALERARSHAAGTLVEARELGLTGAVSDVAAPERTN